MRGLRTTQGTYLVTSSGILLSSGHSIKEDEIADFLRVGLEKYEALSRAERLGKATVKSRVSSSSGFPDDGLALNVVLHKFYPSKPVGRAAIGAVEWNRDFAWFKAEEAAQLLPPNPTRGKSYEIPQGLIERLARFHFTDTVRAFADSYPQRCVKEARLTAEVLSVKDGTVRILYQGTVHAEQKDTPRFGTSRGRLPRRAERSFKAELLGHATYDLKRKRFTKFELVALGVQQGGGERSSPDPVPIGVALTLVGDSPVERVEPFHLDLYGWD